MLTLFLAFGCQGKREGALAEIVRLGGRHDGDVKQAERPVAKVDLGFTAADDATVKSLTALPDVQELYLWNTGVTDAGLALLAKFDRLEKLDLSGTAITDAGLAHLSGLTRLKELNLKGTQVSDRAVKELRKALPGAKIAR
jgi:hypothetical protein